MGDQPMKDHYSFRRGKRGAVIPPPRNKVQISIRLDPDILEWFRDRVKGGGSYQTLINDALRAHIEGEDLDERLRAVIREELAAAPVKAARKVAGKKVKKAG